MSPWRDGRCTDALNIMICNRYFQILHSAEYVWMHVSTLSPSVRPSGCRRLLRAMRVAWTLSLQNSTTDTFRRDTTRRHTTRTRAKSSPRRYGTSSLIYRIRIYRIYTSTSCLLFNLVLRCARSLYVSPIRYRTIVSRSKILLCSSLEDIIRRDVSIEGK